MGASPARKAWNQANKARRAEYCRRWREKNRARVAANMRAWRARNAKHYRAWVEKNQAKIRARAWKRRKAVLGRVCDDCGRDDSEATWSSIKDQCGACRAREDYNGRCKKPRCGAILRRKMRVHGPAAKGRRGRLYCPECHERRGKLEPSPTLVSLWDLLWGADLSQSFRLTWQDVARVDGSSEQAARRQLARLQARIKKFQVDYRVAETELGNHVAVFDARKLRDILRPLIFPEEAQSA